MESASYKVTVDATIRSQAPSLGFLNTVLIRLTQRTEEFLQNESDGRVLMSLGSYPSPSLPDRHISLELSEFAPDNVYQHLFTRIHDRLLSGLISDQIVVESQKSDLPQGSLLMKLSVVLTHKSYIVVPSYTSVAYKPGSESDTCAICLEGLSESKTETAYFSQLPHCIHLFHETCLIEWIDRGNATCPLCRQDNDHTKSLIS